MVCKGFFAFSLLLFLMSVCFGEAEYIYYRWQGEYVTDMAGFREYPASFRKRNWGVSTSLTLGMSSYINRECRILIKPLGLADSLSGLENYQVGAAWCSLKVSTAPTNSQTFYVYPLARDWAEGLGSATPGNCCWDSAANNIAWTLEGGDFSSDIVDSFDITVETPPVNGYVVIDLKSYVDSVFHGADDYGVGIVVKETGVYSNFIVYSDDATTQSNAPIISVRMDYLYTQDGVSPDTIYCFQTGTYFINYSEKRDTSVFYWSVDTTSQPHDSSVFYGHCEEGGGICKNLTCDSINSFCDIVWGLAEVNDTIFYRATKAFALFDSREPSGIDSIEEIDSLFIRFKSLCWGGPDGDSLFIVKFIPRESSSPYSINYSAIDNLCNYGKCSLEVWIEPDSLSYLPSDYPPVPIWKQLKIENGFFNMGDTTGIGIIAKRTADGAPMGDNSHNLLAGSGALQLIYYFSEDEDGNGMTVDSLKGENWSLDPWGLSRYGCTSWGSRRW